MLRGPRNPFIFALIALAVSLATASSSSAGALINSCKTVFTTKYAVRLFKASVTLSQRVRDNAPHFWAFSRVRGSDYFGDELKFEGLVVGDAHPGNFVLAPLNGKLEFYVPDVKDAGRGPLLLDLQRLVMSTQSIFERVENKPKLRDLTDVLYDSYLRGLGGERAPIPNWLEPAFSKTMDDFEREAKKYVRDHVVYERFKFQQDKVAPLDTDPSMSQSEIQKLRADLSAASKFLSPDGAVLDFAIRPRERGGSKELARYWTLVKVGGELSIIEFKRIGDSSVASFEPQEDTVPRYKKLMKTFWGKLDPNMQIVSLMGQQFIMRPKKIELFEVPYSPNKAEKQRQLIELAGFDANYLGRLHASQLKDATYLKKLLTEKKRIKKAIRTFTKDYLGTMTAETGSQDDQP